MIDLPDLDALERTVRSALRPERVVYLPPDLHDALSRVVPRVIAELRERREAEARGTPPGGGR